MASFYWNNNGRIGNLLFQYAAILRYTTAEDTVYTLCNDVFDLIEPDARFRVLLTKNRLMRRLNRDLNGITRKLAKLRVLGSLQPESEILLGKYLVERAKVVKRRGLLPHFWVIEGYFQFADLNTTSIEIRRKIYRSAKGALVDVAGSGVTVAVHIRMTDYRDWMVLGIPGALVPSEWYRCQMRALRVRIASPKFVVFSDDTAAASRLHLGGDVVYFRSTSPIEDFAAMAQCDHAIISPSSFAWWAALTRVHPGKIVIAPKYWAGFKSRVWYPATIETASVEYCPIEDFQDAKKV